MSDWYDADKARARLAELRVGIARKLEQITTVRVEEEKLQAELEPLSVEKLQIIALLQAEGELAPKTLTPIL